MIVRSLDINGDWTFGKGKNDYKSEKDAIAQIIATRIKQFLGDCFFAIDEGIDWFNLMGGKDTAGLKLIISTKILNTPGVTGLREIFVNRSNTRLITISYEADTVYGVLNTLINQEF